MALPSPRSYAIGEQKFHRTHGVSLPCSNFSKFKGNELQQFTGIHDVCPSWLPLRKVSFVAGHEEISFSGDSASDELVVSRIRGDTGDWNCVQKIAAAAEHAEQGIHLVCRETKPWPAEYIGVFLENLGREARRNQTPG